MNKVTVTDAAALYDVNRKTIERWCYAAGIEIEIEQGRAIVDVDALKAAGRKVYERVAVQADDVNVQADDVNVQADDVNVQAQLTVEKVRKDYPWTLAGCLKTDHIEDLELQHSVRMLHGGYMDPQHGWLSSCGGTRALAEGPDERVPLAKTQAIARAQWRNFLKHRAS
jgi:predicted site-specific integrase-resolvase